MSQERRVDLEEIRALIQLATEADITELDVDAPHVKVRIKKAARNSVERVTAVVPRTDGAIPEAAPGGLVPIVAPMVGTFYRAPKPDVPPFVNEGDDVHAGQTVCILEAMKLMPQSRHTSAKWGFSARNPYPGWMASTPSSSAVLIMLGMLR